MLVTLLIGLVGTQFQYPVPPKIPAYGWASLDTYNQNRKCNWARRYCTLGGVVGFDLEFERSGPTYRVKGTCRVRGAEGAAVVGTFAVSRQSPNGVLSVTSGTHRWSGAWNYHTGSFDAWERPGTSAIHLWQVLPAISLQFLEGRKPLEKPRDVPDNVMGDATRTETNFGFEADYAGVVQSADVSLKRVGWTKLTEAGSTSGTNRTCYYEPGPSGRAIVVYKDMSVPDEEFTSDIITGGTRKGGWVALSISCQKKHA